MSDVASRPPEELLVVDDNPVTRYATSRVLRAAGYTVHEAATGGEALAAADARMAGVVLDVHLPDMNGFEVCQALRDRPDTARVPVIHLSAAYVGDLDKVRGLDSGADAYMTHPAEPALLIATLGALIRERMAEDRVRRSEAHFRAIYDAAPSGIALIDAQGRFADVNPAMRTMLGRSTSDIVGQAVAGFVPEGVDVSAFLSALQAADGWRGELPLVGADARVLSLEWTLSAHAEPGVTLGVAIDISERLALARQREALLEREQAARTAAERLNRAKDEFIAVLSHELRTPLNSIVTWVHVLKRPDLAADMLERGLDAIGRNVHIQSRLVSDILDVSRMDLGKLRLDVEPLDAAELLRSAVATLGSLAREKSIEIELDVGGISRPVVADPGRLQQIAWNLITNAIKFSATGSRVRVIGRQDEQGLEMRFEDQGVGIRPEFLPYLFDRFSQGESGSARRHGGLGLGLSIVQQLAELHGGTVTAHSDGEGRGATFVVTLPREVPVARAVPERRGQPEREGGELSLDALRILVVDDDAEAREMLALILGERGASTVTADSAAAALAALDGPVQRFDVMVSDVGMPGQDGHALVRALREREAQAGGGRLPAVALTAFARPKDRDLALASGFDAHCGKPLKPHELASAILRVVGGGDTPERPTPG